jgi:hypothetical protein
VYLGELQKQIVIQRNNLIVQVKDVFDKRDDRIFEERDGLNMFLEGKFS